ncbi:MAG TPA: 3-methyl-2-oxobutanoate hydroxymethyltransferase [Burkholderiaceae bacterium]|jgi:3-methyl-2-oxobutanoate hydroxymethyltransferase|nr:3-methyl-2-oxobutanoate hydroxymethyltransferase [Burkholderiaceae bacterium]
MRLTLLDLRRIAAERKIAMLTCYDASFAAVLDRAGIDVLLIGDSLGMVIQGHDSTLPVTVDDVAYHTRAVARGSQHALIVADMPFGSYQGSALAAFDNAVRLLQAGAQMVKLEGGEEMAPTIGFLVERGVPVCGHVGLTPQHVNRFGGYRIQGRGQAAARIRSAARAVAAAGAEMIVIEAVPEPLARAIATESKALTIGIGASVACSGQVLVLHDMLGVAVDKRPRFVKNFLLEAGSVEAAARAYLAQVQSGQFPTAEHVYPDSN